METTLTIDISKNHIDEIIRESVIKSVKNTYYSAEMDKKAREIIEKYYKKRIDKAFLDGSFITSLAKNLAINNPELNRMIMEKIDIEEIKRNVTERIAEKIANAMLAKLK